MQPQDDDTTNPGEKAAEPAADPETRACMRWGIASIAAGGAVIIALYTAVALGTDIHPEVGRGATTGWIGALVCGLMLILAAKIMSHVDRVGAARTASAKRIEATQTQIAEELVGIHAGVRVILGAGVRSTADWDRKIDEKLEDMHEEINKDIANALLGRLHPEDGSVVEMRPRRPV